MQVVLKRGLEAIAGQGTRARSCDWVVSNRFTQSVPVQTLPDRSTATDALPESISWHRSTERRAQRPGRGVRQASARAETWTPARTLPARVRFFFFFFFELESKTGGRLAKLLDTKACAFVLSLRPTTTLPLSLYARPLRCRARPGPPPPHQCVAQCGSAPKMPLTRADPRSGGRRLGRERPRRPPPAAMSPRDRRGLGLGRGWGLGARVGVGAEPGWAGDLGSLHGTGARMPARPIFSVFDRLIDQSINLLIIY